MTTEIKRYLNEVSGHLICSKFTRSQLLNGLKDELSASPDISSSASYDDLCTKLGSPALIAAQMMENISKNEIEKIKRRKKLAVYSTLLFSIFLSLICVYYIYAHSIIRGDFYVKESSSVSDTFIVSDGMLQG